ncbi:hypothetical protein AVEN_208512-1 [Araneus ventricosus]|uniref:RNase H type-1 domain-containing protein n=1 Tax=Araneus ventricosus TaxID=182803 RepID=A0A4Y2E6G3_ARAVE|nr:hypothetical protein AVEN_208512-1 [Araneus ventricosus]
MEAINFAAGWALERNVEIKVFSDSKSSIEEIGSLKVKSNFILSVKDNLYIVKDLVSFFWVKFHSGNPGNELADHFVKIASSCGAYMSIPAPYSYVKRVCKEFLMNEWNSYWKNSTTADAAMGDTQLETEESQWREIEKKASFGNDIHDIIPRQIHNPTITLHIPKQRRESAGPTATLFLPDVLLTSARFTLRMRLPPFTIRYSIRTETGFDSGLTGGEAVSCRLNGLPESSVNLWKNRFFLPETPSFSILVLLFRSSS